MSVTVTTVVNQPNTKVFEVEADADGDTTATIPHGLTVIPEFVDIVALALEYYLSEWRVTTIDATNVVLTKETTAGSGAAGAQVRVNVQRPHSLTR